ncbi:chromate transporter [Haloechinothrix alba]|uniref:Chromate transporter n=1 Tax=Haloechinothrix alba TaxID=664784 RepID=A0A238W8A2_9PSEU|nr:chromate efflux transporter [Haloechinothrix alba]SNR42738.1 chromate transporter [Haloechinothrix alba]
MVIRRRGTAREVFTVFLGLGLTSFGGPVAHLGYFRDTFVSRRQWLSERAYADLVALCQFLPGPASSQVGMAIGLHRAGIGGLLAAWTAFTLPSAVALVAFAYGARAVGMDAGAGWIDGLKAAAVAVVAHAVLGMARNLTPDRERAAIAVAGMVGALLAPTAIAQALVIVLAGIAGLLWLETPDQRVDAQDSFAVRIGRGTAAGCLVAFGALLAALPVLAAVTGDGIVRLVDSFYRAGSLVFGGGHVVLPLLQAETVRTGLVDNETFLAGYGAAQAVPGPLFTFAAYLGAFAETVPTAAIGAAIALLAIFLPSALLVIGALPLWEQLRRNPLAQRALMGVNAGVVGLLAAALYTPVFTSGVTSTVTMSVAAVSFVALAAWRVPAWAVVISAGAAGALLL